MIRCVFSGVRSNKAQALEIDLETFINYCKNPTVKEGKDGALFSCSEFKHGIRSKENVELCYAAVLDFDNDDVDFPIDPFELCAELDEIQHIWYTSFSNGKDGVVKWRLIVPFDEPLSRVDAEKATYGLWKFMGSPEGVDPRSFYPEQVWYLPSHPKHRAALYQWGLGVGVPLVTSTAIRQGSDYKREDNKDSAQALKFDDISKIDLTGPIAEGARNETLFKVGCYYRSLGLKVNDIYSLLLVHNERCEGSGLPQAELKTIAASAARYKPSAQERYGKTIEIFKELYGDATREFFSGDLKVKENGIWISAFEKDCVQATQAELILKTKVGHTHTEKFLRKYRKSLEPELLLEFPVWDGVDHIAELCSYLNPADFTVEQVTELVKDFCAKLYERIKDPLIQNRFLVLEGGQGIGKETWLHVLFRAFDFYYMKPSDINQYQIKDTHQQLAKHLVCHIEEFDRLTNVSNATLKDLITREQVTFRPAYGHTDIKQHVRASFVGSCNRSDYLRDTTGNRRFLIIKLHGSPGEAIRFGYPRHRAKQLAILGQIKHLGDNGYRCSNGTELALAQLQEERTPEDPAVRILNMFDWLSWPTAINQHPKQEYARLISKAEGRVHCEKIARIEEIRIGKVLDVLKGDHRDFRTEKARSWVTYEPPSDVDFDPLVLRGENTFYN